MDDKQKLLAMEQLREQLKEQLIALSESDTDNTVQKSSETVQKQSDTAKVKVDPEEINKYAEGFADTCGLTKVSKDTKTVVNNAKAVEDSTKTLASDTATLVKDAKTAKVKVDQAEVSEIAAMFASDFGLEKTTKAKQQEKQQKKQEKQQKALKDINEALKSLNKNQEIEIETDDTDNTPDTVSIDTGSKIRRNFKGEAIDANTGEKLSELEVEQEAVRTKSEAKKAFEGAVADTEVTADMYARGQRVLAKEIAGVQTEEKFNPEDYVVAAIIKQNNGRKPEFMPNPKDKRMQIHSFNSIRAEKVKLSTDNSVDCSGLRNSQFFNSDMPAFIMQSKFATNIIKRKTFGEILSRAQESLNGKEISRVVIDNNTMIINGKYINLNGAISDSGIRISDLVDIQVLKSKAPQLSGLAVDLETADIICGQFDMDRESDTCELSKAIFEYFNNLNELFIGGTKIRRSDVASGKVDNTALKEKRQFDEFDAELKSRVSRRSTKETAFDELHKKNREKVMSSAEKRCTKRVSTKRKVGGFAVKSVAFVVSFPAIGLFMLADHVAKGKIKEKAGTVKDGFKDSGKKALSFGDNILNIPNMFKHRGEEETHE